jgi:hypothetical protein
MVFLDVYGKMAKPDLGTGKVGPDTGSFQLR